MGAGGSVIADKCSSKKGGKGEKKQFKDYTIGDFIADGVSGKVHSGKNITNDTDVALKFFGYCKNYDAKFQDIRLEIDAMMAVRGIEGLVQIEGFFLDTKQGLLPDKIEQNAYPVIIMELLVGGPLFGRINYRDSISEQFIALTFKKMIFALRSLHKKNFIHRDLKLDNVMFLEKSSDSPIKIIDLGNVVELDTSDAVFKGQHMVGTPGFLAPETILHKEYSKKSDIWQAGCTLYSLLSGLPPFDPNNNKQVTEFAYYPMTGPAWDDISTSAKSLVTKMLKRNPDHRISVSDILDHPWLVDEAPNKEFNRDYFTRIKHLALRNKMKAFFLETSLLEGHTKRRKSLRDAIPIFRHASDVALLSASHSRSQSQFEVVDQVDEGTRNDVEAFQSKMRILKNMVVTSIAGGGGHWGAGVGGRKEINYTAFTELLTECHLQELCTLHVFNIFDIGNTGTIDPREFLLTMLAFRTDNGGAGGEGSSSGASGIPAMLARHKENKDEDGDPFSGSVSMSHVTDSQHHQQPAPPGENEDEIRLLFNVFDIKETGYIDLEELKIAVNFLLYMGSDQPQALPNIHELFSIIDVSQNGRIDYPEFKQFYRHLIASHIPQAPVSLTND